MTRPWKRETQVISEHKEVLMVQEIHGETTKLREATLDDLIAAAKAEGYDLKARKP